MIANHMFTLSKALLDDIRVWVGELYTISELSGGITNRNYRLDAERGAFVMRVAGAKTEWLGIDRAIEFACASEAHRIGIGAEVVAYLQQHKATLMRFVPNAKTLTVETATQPTLMRRIVDVLKKTHNAPSFSSRFDPFQTVRDYHALALKHGVEFPNSLPHVFSRMGEIESALQLHAKSCPCHNDLLPGNFLDDGDKLWLIDWEYAGNGNPFFDLGNFAVNLELDAPQCQKLIELYFSEVTPKQTAQLNLMRLASDLRESFWGFLQSGISDLDFDFIGYAHKHLNRFRASADTPDITRDIRLLHEVRVIG